MTFDPDAVTVTDLLRPVFEAELSGDDVWKSLALDALNAWNIFMGKREPLAQAQQEKV